MIERKYNKLIEQKTIFAKRALARIHYILREGQGDGDGMEKLVQLLNCSSKKDEILEELGGKIPMTASFKNMTDDSFSGRKERRNVEFIPMGTVEKEGEIPPEITDFVPKPLYTKGQLQRFREKNMEGNRFVATETTVQSVEDLEKLLFLWQEETENHTTEETVSADGDIWGKNGFTYSKLVIEEKAKEAEKALANASDALARKMKKVDISSSIKSLKEYSDNLKDSWYSKEAIKKPYEYDDKLSYYIINVFSNITKDLKNYDPIDIKKTLKLYEQREKELNQLKDIIEKADSTVEYFKFDGIEYPRSELPKALNKLSSLLMKCNKITLIRHSSYLKMNHEIDKQCMKLFKATCRYIDELERQSTNKEESYIDMDYINAITEAEMYELEL